MANIHYVEFSGQVVLITGAASGIGAAQARHFLAQDANVFAIDCQVGQLSLLEQEYPHQFAYLIGDVTCQSVLQQAVTACCERFGAINILLLTAGVLDNYQPLLEMSMEDYDRLQLVNVRSFVSLARLVLPMMLAQKAGTMVVMTSIAGIVAGGGGMAYTMSKHALVGFVKQLALDYAEDGIHINGIAPGAVNTPMNAADFAGAGEMAQQVAAETPVKRWANPEEVADLTLFLSSQQARYMQGTIVPIDGGWTIK